MAMVFEPVAWPCEWLVRHLLQRFVIHQASLRTKGTL
jgi:hypothetical protein